jgi:hypothetical protein
MIRLNESALSDTPGSGHTFQGVPILATPTGNSKNSRLQEESVEHFSPGLLGDIHGIA